MGEMHAVQPLTATRSYWRAGTSPPVLDMTVGDLLRAAASEVPQANALIDGCGDPAERRAWTYAELLDDSEQLARGLLQHFQPGERVLIVAPNSARWADRWARRLLASCWPQRTRPTRNANWSTCCGGRRHPVSSSRGSTEATIVLAMMRRLVADLPQRAPCAAAGGTGRSVGGRSDDRTAARSAVRGPGPNPVHRGHDGLSRGSAPPPSRHQQHAELRPDAGRNANWRHLDQRDAAVPRGRVRHHRPRHCGAARDARGDADSNPRRCSTVRDVGRQDRRWFPTMLVARRPSGHLGAAISQACTRSSPCGAPVPAEPHPPDQAHVRLSSSTNSSWTD